MIILDISTLGSHFKIVEYLQFYNKFHNVEDVNSKILFIFGSIKKKIMLKMYTKKMKTFPLLAKSK